jgi:hypothetical protein
MLKSNNYKLGTRKPPQNPMPIKIGFPLFKINQTLNAAMLKHYELQLQ